MKDYIVKDNWKIIEDRYSLDHNQISESLMSLGNGAMGQRANFEETYTGTTLQGNYVAGVYYPDETKVGWWKNGYPEYFAKVLNACNWTAIEIKVENEIVDIHTAANISQWHRELDMQAGHLKRIMTIELQSGKMLKIESTRINSLAITELGAFTYSITPINFIGTVEIKSLLDFDVINSDSNYDIKFWDEQSQSGGPDTCHVIASTKKTEFVVGVAQRHNLWVKNEKHVPDVKYFSASKQAGVSFSLDLKKGETITLEKFAIVSSSLNVDADKMATHITKEVTLAADQGWRKAYTDHKSKWSEIWKLCDITIAGDVAAQQGIRFNIFQLFQTYTGKDNRLNIGPKGFTGEKYGGSTYWDTEAYCLPFYLGTADPSVAKNLLIYRYKHLDKAIENAAKLGFTNGAALYPMVTMNGEECHNEWEITFEEIHRNGAIAYAIYDYIGYTDDKAHLAEYGFEVLLGISRFWAQRVNWSSKKEKYVMLGVTGPNEYENNVNNNWYTNYIASWCLKYTSKVYQYLQQNNKEKLSTLVSKTNFDSEELKKWKHIIDNMYLPKDEELDLYLQQDGFLDKEIIEVKNLPEVDRPLNQKWSWDRILRSCYIKQADTLQGFYFFEDDFTEAEHRKHFLYYEPLTVHESSLSPCVHGILASKLKMDDKAYEMYLRTSRLDLDDYNNDTEDGCHITSMAGTWLSIVKGFGGQRIKDGLLSLAPRIPNQWESLGFKIMYRGVLYHINIDGKHVSIKNLAEQNGEILIYGTKHVTIADEALTVDTLVSKAE